MAGFPPAGQSLAVLGPTLVVLDARSISSLLRRAREGVSLGRHSTTVTIIVEGCVYIRRCLIEFFS